MEDERGVTTDRGIRMIFQIFGHLRLGGGIRIGSERTRLGGSYL
jgi:hypothetical protein